MRDSKLLGSIREAIEAAGLKDGDTISFHHSFREGTASFLLYALLGIAF